MPATLDGRLMALLAVLVALGACATGAPAERLVAQTAHPLPPSEKRPLVRCAIDGEYLVLTAVLELGCKQVEQRIYEPSEPTEHAHKRFESLVLPKIVPCGEAPMQLAERAAMAGESFAPPPSVRKAMQSRRMTRVAAIDTIGEIDAAIKRDSSSLCNGAVSVAGALTSVAAGKDPRMMWIWPVLQATLGDAAQEYLTDACSRLLALWPS